MINASDKTEPAASLPTCLHIASISSTSVFAQISNAVPAEVSVGEFMSFASCNYCHERTTVSSIQISENVRRSALSQLAFLVKHEIYIYSSIFVESEIGSIEDSWRPKRRKLTKVTIDSVINHAAGTRGCRNIPACLYRTKARFDS